MDRTEKLLLLMDLQKKLAYLRYDMLGLMNLDKLRGEVEKEISLLTKKDSDEQN